MTKLQQRFTWFLVLLAVLSVPAIASAHAGAGAGGMANGGHHHHNNYGGWGWGWYWDPSWYGNYYYNYNQQAVMNAVAAQQQYDLAVLQYQTALLRQQQKELRQLQQNQPAAAAPQQPAAVRAVAGLERPAAAQTVALTAEQRAAGKFRLAMRLADDGKTADAAEYCTDIVRDFPGTPTAARAQAFLAKVNSR